MEDLTVQDVCAVVFGAGVVHGLGQRGQRRNQFRPGHLDQTGGDECDKRLVHEAVTAKKGALQKA